MNTFENISNLNEVEASNKRVRSLSIQRDLQQLNYRDQLSKKITCEGSFGSFTIDQTSYNIGCACLPKSVYDRARVCNLSTYIDGLFSHPGNVFQKVESFFKDKLEDLCTYDLYILPIDLKARAQGKKNCDIPNVNFAITSIFLKYLPHHDFVVCDPLHKGTDQYVNVVNYTHVLRKLHEKRVRVKTFKNPTSDSSKGLNIVMYQRGTGDPDPKAMQAISEATHGLSNEDMMHVHLVPGKDGVGLMGGNCYTDFATNAALILHELSALDEYCIRKKKVYFNDIKFVLDSFSAYAAYTAVAVHGYGISDMCHILAGRTINGKLTYTEVAMESR